MIGIVATDLAASVAFYRALGVELPDDPGPHVETTLPSGLRFALDSEESVRAFNPRWHSPNGHPRTGIAFLCASPSDVDKQFAELTAAGHHGAAEPWDAPWGQRYATVHDPDGNPVDLFAWHS